MSGQPLVSIVIPHYLGDILSECLEFVYGRTEGIVFEVIVADDQPYDDGSLARAKQKFPDIRVVQTGGGKGMGVGCNRGLEVARGQYAVLLNNDVEVTENWLLPLVAAAEAYPDVAACQPKVRSLRERSRFDYGGAAGGMMDRLGFTFCLGRLFDAVEEDLGQYDRMRPIFWAVGGAMFVRMSCLEKTGLMDEHFYMHMEEIDLCWRLQLAGWRVLSVPESVVYHYGGFSLATESFRKAYLNHRNQLVLLLKNDSPARLLWLMPVRAGLVLATFALGILKRDWKQPVAALAGLCWVLIHPVNIWKRRSSTQKVRVVPHAVVARTMYRGSVVIQYFLRGVRVASDLPGIEDGRGGA